MWRFVLSENIRRFDALMRHSRSDEERATLQRLLKDAQVELAELEEASTPEIARRDEWLNSFANSAVDEAMALQGAQFGSLQVFDESREQLIILAQRNLRAKFLHRLANLRPGDGSACGRCLAEDAPVAIGDVNRDSEFEPHRDAAREAGFRAVRALPVRDGSGKLIAVLSTYFEAPRQFAGDDFSRLNDFTKVIGGKLEGYIASSLEP